MLFPSFSPLLQPLVLVPAHSCRSCLPFPSSVLALVRANSIRALRVSFPPFLDRWSKPEFAPPRMLKSYSLTL
jgi:hypothetical protein